MEINQAGIDLLKECEGCRLEAYPDPASGGEPWTVGYGHTGDDVYKGYTVSQEEAEEILRRDLVKFERGVLNSAKVALNSNQFSALVCFAYNIGLENLRSSLLMKCVNSYHPEDASKQFARWNHAAGIVMPGLTARREKERLLFITPV